MNPSGIKIRVALILAAAVLAVPGIFAQAAEVKVLSSNGVHSVLVELLPEFERATGHRVAISYDTANLLLGRIKAGETADLVILTRPTLEELIRQGKVAPGGGKDLSRSGVEIGRAHV